MSGAFYKVDSEEAEWNSERVYEDENTLVIMDIMPRTDGHCLVIPKTAARNMLDATQERLAELRQQREAIDQTIAELESIEAMSREHLAERQKDQ